MTSWLIAALMGLSAAALSYTRLRAPSPALRLGLALVRAAALTLLLALLLDAPFGRARPLPPAVFVDASLSMTREGTDLSRIAWDSANAVGADSTWAFGDTIRPAEDAAAARDAATRVRPVAERTMATGRPAVVITDGEVQDSSAMDALVSGSRIIVVPRPARQDAAIVSMDAPRAAVEGDSLNVKVTVASGAQATAAGMVVLTLDERPLGEWTLDSMSPWSERQLDVWVHATAPQGPGVLRAIVNTSGDAERRNDTLAAAIELSRAASAAFVSTSPDQDARFAIAVLRGTLALPTRGFLRVAPGQWRNEGALTPATEAEVRAALRDAPVAILHGDTAIFGPPRSLTVGPLALMVPADAEDGEWYPVGTPPSPLSGALSAVPLDSLPPVAAGVPAAGDWIALEARRGREAIRRAIVSGSDEPRRVAIVTGSGFWRWRFRGGASADAFAAMWGGIFDWLAAERADRRSAVPDESAVRAGQMIRWRRGSSSDTVVRVAIQPRQVGRADTLVLRFGTGVSALETAPLPPGVYDVIVPGGRTVLVVNPSAELLPSRPRLRSGSIGTRTHVDDARRSRNKGLLYVLAVALLCGEWILRRRFGLR